MRGTITTLFSLGALAVLAGCYHYVPAELGDAVAGRQVRLRVTPAEASRFTALLPQGGRVLEGRVVNGGSDSLLIDVPIASNDVGARIEVVNQRLDVARAGIVDVEVRELDRTRTILTVLGTGAIGGIILGKAISEAFGSDRSENGTPPEDLVVPIFIRIRW